MHCLPDICGQQPPPQRGCLKYKERNKQRCQKYQRCRCVCVGGGGCRALENVRLFRTTDLSHLPRNTRSALRATGDHELSPRPVLFLVLWGPQTGYKAESPEYQTGRGPLFRQHPSAAVSCPGIHSSPPISGCRRTGMSYFITLLLFPGASGTSWKRYRNLSNISHLRELFFVLFQTSIPAVKAVCYSGILSIMGCRKTSSSDMKQVLRTESEAGHSSLCLQRGVK